MSSDMTGDGYGSPRTTTGEGSGTVETAKREAAALKDTAMDAEKGVLHTAKDEAASVVEETRAQASDLFTQTRQELSDQASKQQERIARGLRSIGDELGAMARSSEGNGMAGDLVRRVSGTVTHAGAWLADRDPAGVMGDVKAFARRRPGAFIGGALLAGIAAGRLTRALATNAQTSSGGASVGDRGGSPTPASTAPTGSAAPTAASVSQAGAVAGAPAQPAGPEVAVGRPAETSASTAGVHDDSPLYAESVARFDAGEEGSHDRSDPL